MFCHSGHFLAAKLRHWATLPGSSASTSSSSSSSSSSRTNSTNSSNTSGNFKPYGISAAWHGLQPLLFPSLSLWTVTIKTNTNRCLFFFYSFYYFILWLSLIINEVTFFWHLSKCPQTKPQVHGRWPLSNHFMTSWLLPLYSTEFHCRSLFFYCSAQAHAYRDES